MVHGVKAKTTGALTRGDHLANEPLTRLAPTAFTVKVLAAGGGSLFQCQ